MSWHSSSPDNSVSVHHATVQKHTNCPVELSHTLSISLGMHIPFITQRHARSGTAAPIHSAARSTVPLRHLHCTHTHVLVESALISAPCLLHMVDRNRRPQLARFCGESKPHARLCADSSPNTCSTASGAIGSSVPTPEALVPLDHLCVVLRLLLGSSSRCKLCTPSWSPPMPALCESLAPSRLLPWFLRSNSAPLVVTGTPVTLATVKQRSKTVGDRKLCRPLLSHRHSCDTATAKRRTL